MGKRRTRHQWHDLFVSKITMTGSLKKRNSHSSKLLQRWNKRWFFLTDEVLAYAKNCKDSVMRGTTPVKDIVDVRAIDCAHDGVFEVVVPKRTFVLRSKSSNQRMHWIEAIKKACHAQGLHDLGVDIHDAGIQMEAAVAVAEKSSSARRHALEVAVHDPAGEDPFQSPQQQPQVQSLRERFSTPPVLSSLVANDEASSEESDGYQSNGSWNASELEEMSPIPTPTDPKLWHPRFQDHRSDDEDAEALHSLQPRILIPAQTPSSSGPASGRSAPKTPVTPMDALNLSLKSPKSNAGRRSHEVHTARTHPPDTPDTPTILLSSPSGIGRSNSERMMRSRRSFGDSGDGSRSPDLKKQSLKEKVLHRVNLRKSKKKSRLSKGNDSGQHGDQPTIEGATVLYSNAMYSDEPMGSETSPK